MPTTAPSLQVDVKVLCVIGLGYVGLPTALMFAKAGYKVKGYDNNSLLVAELNRCQTDMNEDGILDLLQFGLNNGTFKAYSEIPLADAYFICVPTPVREISHEPDLSAVFSAVNEVKKVLKPGGLVVLESTSPVGTTRLAYYELLRHLQEKNPGADFHMAYCPERILPGNVLVELSQLDRVLGGINELSASIAHSYFSNITKGICYETDAQTAEFVKLSENSFRDVNIAFANELKNLCEIHGVDIEVVRGFANMHPRVDILQPGIGVGGHCIPVDPWLLLHDSPQEDDSVIYSARRVNDRQPILVAEKILANIRKYSHTKLAVFGLTYKANVNDFRESPALDIVKYLSNHSKCKIDLYDPYLENADQESMLHGATRRSLAKVANADLYIFLVAHDEFVPLVNQYVDSGYAILDFCNLKRISTDRNVVIS